MNHETLPDQWATQPLHDLERVAEVVDLLLDETDRIEGTLLALVTDADALLLVPVKIDELPLDCPPREQRACLRNLTDLVKHLTPAGGLAIGIGRDGQGAPTAWDSGWRHAQAEACRRSGVVDLGCALATPTGTIALDDDTAAA